MLVCSCRINQAHIGFACQVKAVNTGIPASCCCLTRAPSIIEGDLQVDR